MKLLIVEDEPKTAAYLKKGLEENGFVADVAGDGETGAYMARQGGYELVILDVMLRQTLRHPLPSVTLAMALPEANSPRDAVAQALGTGRVNAGRAHRQRLTGMVQSLLPLTLPRRPARTLL